LNSFLFITHVTPKAKRSELRSSLYEIHLRALSAHTYDKWKVLCIGEEEKKDSKFFQVSLKQTLDKNEISNQLSEIYSRKDVLEYINESNYIVKLDDDDIISPKILERLAYFIGDVYYDEFHAFYDITSSQVSLQKRDWIASTCIQKTEHAITKLRIEGLNNIYLNSIFYSDHSQIWHKYYANKQKFISDKFHPIYLRVLSPTSITAGVGNSILNSVNDIDFENYFEYLNKFGSWNEKIPEEFMNYNKPLRDSWLSFSGTEHISIPLKKQDIFSRISKSLVKYVRREN
jgi:hypothetical protein